MPVPRQGAEILVLDGGLGQELHRRSSQPPSPLWSVQIMMDEPELVETVHLEFVEAGAPVITVNSYTATPSQLARAGQAAMFDAVHDAAMAAANAARQKSGRDIRIAGCLPPLVASYRPELMLPEDICLSDYRRIAAAQRDHVDRSRMDCDGIEVIR